jgi:cytoskeletal protein RodZ
MSNEKDKELDDLFRKRLDDPVDHISYDENDWMAMEQMLDKQKRRGIIYWLPVISSVAALLLIALGWWTFRKQTPDVITKSQTQAVSHHQQAKIDTVKTVQSKVTPAPVAPQQAIAQTKIIQAKPLPVQSFATVPQVSKHHITNNSGTNNTPAMLSANTGTPQKTDVTNTDAGELVSRPGTELVASASALQTSETEIVAALPVADITIPKSAYAKVAAENADGKTKAVTKQGAFRPKYAISVLAAPDLNGAGTFQQSKLGSNFGVMFAAGLTSKFTVSTGALYSDKPYAAGFGNYHTPYQFSTAPSSVLANCDMIDIPLNVGYQLYNKHQNKFSVGTGLSSYIMLHEEFKFSYAGNAAAGPAYFEVPHSSGYYFGIMNLNATYERRINARVGFSVSPYLKVPLTNIGYSQVRLQTTGVALGLNWNLN